MSANAVFFKDIVFKIADSADDENLKMILRQNDMESWIRLAFEREPSFFSADNLMGESYSVIAHKANNASDIIGMYSCTHLPVHINTQVEYLGYLAGLRIDRKYRRKIRYVKNGYQSIQSLVPVKGTLPIWFSSIASENQQARNLLEAGLKGLPEYSFIGEMKSLAISVKQSKNTQILSVVSADDIDELITFYNEQVKSYQFSAVLNKQWLNSLQASQGLSLQDFFIVREHGQIIACLAIWDQRKFKQTVVRGYRFPLDRLTGLYNLYAAITKRASLPGVGEKLEQVYLSFVAVDENYQHLFLDVLQDALYKVKQKNSIIAVIGLSSENPLTEIIEQHFHVHSYKTCIEKVTWQDHAEFVLNSRRVQPEIAIL